VIRTRIALCLASFLAVFAADAQEVPEQQRDDTKGQLSSGTETQKRIPQMLQRASGIVADNLDRVAATASQILEIVNRDAGLMVELKRKLAEDAGESGQILEESDLNESTIAQRLAEDLRSRVLATRLLQEYGYLLPKVNPESDLAAEHNLEIRARAQQLERASEARNSVPAMPQAAMAAETQPRTERPANQGRSARDPIVTAESTNDNARPEMLAAPPETHLDLAKASGRSSLETEPTERTSNVALAEVSNREAEKLSSPMPRSPRVREKPAAEFEPVRMDRRPNPYADVPSLYDLYVQAKSPNRKAERFGLEVFRNGATDPDILPMDLPVGPDYVVGPGDGLSINLWGSVSQRLVRTVDREGRLTLPEAGPLLVSGKSLGEVQESVQRVLRTQFRDVSADVSLLRLRTVRVYVVGEVSSPGAYDISSLSTPLNALFAAGGISSGGSLRRLEHYRGKQLVEEVDAYDLLLHGIRGEVKRRESSTIWTTCEIGAWHSTSRS
jgi:protein involved in polysaccharide export with SLBB domain